MTFHPLFEKVNKPDRAWRGGKIVAIKGSDVYHMRHNNLPDERQAGFTLCGLPVTADWERDGGAHYMGRGKNRHLFVFKGRCQPCTTVLGI